tara:strand:- start:77 stop:829 length:753 start_codon:yes stop_codon:yes gene_type:complete
MKAIYFLFSAVILTSCASSKFEKNKGVSLHQNKNEDTKEAQPIVTRPSEVLSTGYPNLRLIPIYKVNYNSHGENGYTGNTYTHEKYHSPGDSLNAWHHHFMPGLVAIYGYNLFNVCHLDLTTSKKQNFFKENVLVNTVYYPSFAKDTLNGKPVLRDYFLTSVYDEDTNNDSIINQKDLRRFYMFNLEATQPIELVPSNYSVLSSEYDYENDLMYVKARLDENNNGKRDESEPIHIFKISLDKPKAGERIY